MKRNICIITLIRPYTFHSQIATDYCYSAYSPQIAHSCELSPQNRWIEYYDWFAVGRHRSLQIAHGTQDGWQFEFGPNGIFGHRFLYDVHRQQSPHTHWKYSNIDVACNSQNWESNDCSGYCHRTNVSSQYRSFLIIDSVETPYVGIDLALLFHLRKCDRRSYFHPIGSTHTKR